MLTLNKHELGYRIILAHHASHNYESQKPFDLTSDEYIPGRDIMGEILQDMTVTDIDLEQISDININQEQWAIPDEEIHTHINPNDEMIEHAILSIRTLAELFFSKEQVEPILERMSDSWTAQFRLRLLLILLSVMDVTLYHRGMHKLIYKDNEIAVTTFDDPHKAMFRKEFP